MGLQSGYFVASYASSLDDSKQPFALWVPKSYSRRKKYPLLVVLHGSDADHRMIPEQCFRIPELGFREDIIMLSPFGRGDLGFRWAGEADLWDSMNCVKAHYRIDERRQYLSGLSLGGFATWRIACDYPEQWAAIAPVCGWGEAGKLSALKDVAVWCVHGARDELVPVQDSREMVEALKRAELRFRYDELPGWGHNSWEWLYDPNRKKDQLVDWLLRFRKSEAPRPIRQPRREGSFFDLFKERLVISYPSRGLTHHETEVLREEAERIACLDFGGLEMRSGKFIVKADRDVTPHDLKSASHLMLGRTDNHTLMRKAGRRLLARHLRGRLRVLEQYMPGKSIVAAVVQPSPWNSHRLAGVITYQQYHQMQKISRTLFDPERPLETLNVYDLQQHRFVLQAKSSYNSSSRSA